MKHNINRWIFEIPASDVQEEEGNNKGAGDNCCFICGKKIKGKKVYSVHLLTNGNLVSTDENLDNSQGLFTVGSECRKKLPNNFIF